MVIQPGSKLMIGLMYNKKSFSEYLGEN